MTPGLTQDATGIKVTKDCEDTRDLKDVDDFKANNIRLVTGVQEYTG